VRCRSKTTGLDYNLALYRMELGGYAPASAINLQARFFLIWTLFSAGAGKLYQLNFKNLNFQW
jgi:hypothetical protein